MAVTRRGGRKRLPDKTKDLKGTLRKDRQQQAPGPDGQRPAVPGSISPRAQQLMDRLMDAASELDYIDSHHPDIYLLLALRLEQVESNYDFLRKNGSTYTSESRYGGTTIKLRPQARLYSEALKHAHQLLIEVGMTPSAMSRILRGTTKPTADDEWEDFK